MKKLLLLIFALSFISCERSADKPVEEFGDFPTKFVVIDIHVTSNKYRQLYLLESVNVCDLNSVNKNWIIDSSRKYRMWDTLKFTHY